MTDRQAKQNWVDYTLRRRKELANEMDRREARWNRFGRPISRACAILVLMTFRRYPRISWRLEHAHRSLLVWGINYTNAPYQEYKKLFPPWWEYKA